MKNIFFNINSLDATDHFSAAICETQQIIRLNGIQILVNKFTSIATSLKWVIVSTLAMLQAVKIWFYIVGGKVCLVILIIAVD